MYVCNSCKPGSPSNYPLFAAREWGVVPEAELTPASSDASFRRYFRWQAGERSLILMDAPPPQENCEPFVRIAALLSSAGVHVPQVLAADLEQGFLILDDLGRQTYLDVINEHNADQLFDDAIEALLQQQRLPSTAICRITTRRCCVVSYSCFPNGTYNATWGLPLHPSRTPPGSVSVAC